MNRLSDLLNIDIPLPARFSTPAIPASLEADDFDLAEGDGGDDDSEFGVPRKPYFAADDAEVAEPREDSEAENLGDDFFGEGAASTRAAGRKKFDEDDAGGGAEEDPDIEELDDDEDDDADSLDEGEEDLDDDDDFDDDDDDLDDDDDDADDDE